jgi:2-polyprenyl-3-methyl-5-hydroxy-6-metoxy-1,4-benzoquinol methylase
MHEFNRNWLMEEFCAYERTLALRTAIELDLFTHIGAGASTIPALGRATRASARGLRVLCDYLTVHEHLVKRGQRYGLTLSSRLYLTKDSPAYFGSTVRFLASDAYIESLCDLLRTVKQGRARSLKTDWQDYARFMSPLALDVADFVAETITAEIAGPIKVLDVAAGHGLYGLAIAKRNPKAHIHALDFPRVLRVAAKHAREIGVRKRFHLVPGNAFEISYGGPYDLVLTANIAHHLEPAANIELFQKCRAALKAGGRLVLLDFVINDDRVSPAVEAGFALHLFATSSYGVYTLREYRRMLRAAGFRTIRQGEKGDYNRWMITASG